MSEMLSRRNVGVNSVGIVAAFLAWLSTAHAATDSHCVAVCVRQCGYDSGYCEIGCGWNEHKNTSWRQAWLDRDDGPLRHRISNYDFYKACGEFDDVIYDYVHFYDPPPDPE